jgi:AbrB family looped-hinge helix DNA binding protein
MGRNGLYVPVQFKVKLTKIGNSLRITIPKPLVDGLGLKQGDVLILTVTDDQIKISKAKGRGKQD